MHPSVAVFRDVIEKWRDTQARITVELTCSSPEKTLAAFVGKVTDTIDWPIVKFQDEASGSEESLDFSEAEIRPASWEKIDAEVVRRFNVAWDTNTLRFDRGCFTELRNPGRPN
jgi:hypothetical protein